MLTWRIAGVMLATLLIAGCSSVAKEKSEYEKQIDAVPMPTSEMERQEQCTRFSREVLLLMLETATNYKNSSLFKPVDSSTLKRVVIKRRMIAMNCTKAEQQPWESFFGLDQ